MANKINPSRTALFVLDYQVRFSMQHPECAAVMKHGASVIAKARSKGLTIAHCRVAFTEAEMAAIPETNPTFYKAKSDPIYSKFFGLDAPEGAFHPDVAAQVQDGDIFVRKNRVGPFLNAPQDTHKIFKERGIDTLILAGVSTSGAIAATVCQASDLDYRLFVVADACADSTPGRHEYMLEYFDRRATVIRSEDLDTLVE